MTNDAPELDIPVAVAAYIISLDESIEEAPNVEWWTGPSPVSREHDSKSAEAGQPFVNIASLSALLAPAPPAASMAPSLYSPFLRAAHKRPLTSFPRPNNPRSSNLASLVSIRPLTQALHSTARFRSTRTFRPRPVFKSPFKYSTPRYFAMAAAFQKGEVNKLTSYVPPSLPPRDGLNPCKVIDANTSPFLTLVSTSSSPSSPSPASSWSTASRPGAGLAR